MQKEAELARQQQQQHHFLHGIPPPPQPPPGFCPLLLPPPPPVTQPHTRGNLLVIQPVELPRTVVVHEATKAAAAADEAKTKGSA